MESLSSRQSPSSSRIRSCLSAATVRQTEVHLAASCRAPAGGGSARLPALPQQLCPLPSIATDTLARQKELRWFASGATSNSCMAKGKAKVGCSSSRDVRKQTQTLLPYTDPKTAPHQHLGTSFIVTHKLDKTRAAFSPSQTQSSSTKAATASQLQTDVTLQALATPSCPSPALKAGFAPESCLPGKPS